MPTMPQTRAIDPLLTDYAHALSNDMSGALQEVLFPVKRTKGETGTYYEFDANQHFRNYTDYRADGAEANSITWKLDKSTFAMEEYALKTFVTDRERENSLAPIELDQEATNLVTEALLVNRELRSRDAVMVSATGPTLGFTATARWDQNTATTVMTDNESIMQTFQKKTGKRPNLMVIPPIVWKSFIDPTIGANTIGGILHDRLKYTMPMVGNNDVSESLLAQLFGVERVIVPKMVFTDTPLTNSVVKPGTGITGGAYIWDTYTNNSTTTKEIFYFHINPSGGVKSFTYGWTFQSQPLTMFRYREDKERKDWIEGSRVEDPKVVAASAAMAARVLT